jgi:malonyl-CoA decarboxylase
MDVSFFQELLRKISERGRQILDLPALIGSSGQETFESLCQALVSSRGEASGVILASRVLDRYSEAGPSRKDAIFASGLPRGSRA